MSRKKQQKVKIKKTKRHASAAGVFLICFTLVGLIWPIDGGVRYVRKMHREKNGLFEGEAIIVDGNFADTVKPPRQMILEVSPAGGFHSVPDSPTLGESENPDAVRIPEGCVPIMKKYSDIFSGSVLRIDKTHKYQGKLESPMTNFEGKNESYHIRRPDLEIQPVVVEALNRMMLAYHRMTGKSDLMVYSTTEASDTDGSLYPAELPDRATGLCVDLCILNEDETVSMFAKFNDWLSENAWSYGFVFSYPEDGKQLTGIDPAPYHLRYVGKLHSAVMHEYGLSLPNYIEELHHHPISDPYYYHDGMKDYSIYYVKANTGSTIVPTTVTDDCEISGNNQDGFIVFTEGIVQ
ncbi:MAG: D-alanyl-D-alanine carboxypeptidase family protein [Oscillospiraceae bacterium]